jgi:hypothetical protein
VTYPVTALPYGMRDVKLTRYTDASGTVLDSVSVDLPNIQTFSFSESEEYTTLRGDDRVVAIRGQGAIVEWELEAGGMDFRAWEILTGGTVILTGITPNRIWTLRKRATDARPYFRAEGRVVSESGGDMRCVVYRCRANDTVEGQFADGEFFLTSASGQGLPMLDDVFDLLYEMKQYETSTALSSTPSANPALQLPPTTLATGTITATTVVLTWVAAANGTPAASDYKVQRRTAFTDWVDATVSSPTTTGATVTGLTTATQYQFRVRAVTTANGASDWAGPVTATTS